MLVICTDQVMLCYGCVARHAARQHGSSVSSVVEASRKQMPVEKSSRVHMIKGSFGKLGVPVFAKKLKFNFS